MYIYTMPFELNDLRHCRKNSASSGLMADSVKGEEESGFSDCFLGGILAVGQTDRQTVSQSVSQSVSE